MRRLCIAPIVEGHGEDGAVRILLQRVWTELLGGDYVEVLKPIRGSRFKLVKVEELERALNLAALKLRSLEPGTPSFVLVLLDAEDDLPCALAPSILARAKAVRSDVDVSCVIANVEYETWFVAAAASLSRFLDLSRDSVVAGGPEQARQGKGWVQKRFRGVKYSETVDQPAMTSQMDLTLCRQHSLSFDKLCRELERHLRGNQLANGSSQLDNKP